MNFLIFIAKVFATLVVLAFFIVGISKANPRMHNPAYPPLAEYGTGFIMCALAVAGFYYLWVG